MALLVRPRQGGVPADLGRPALPGSKSHAQRALVLAALGANGTPASRGRRLLAAPGRRSSPTCRIENAPRSDDVEVMVGALRAAGAAIDRDGGTLVVRAVPDPARVDFAFDAGENATALRLLLQVVPLLGGRVRASGHERLRRRPIGPVVDALREAGVAITDDEAQLWADGQGTPHAPASIAADVTSQVASGALLALALQGRGARLTVHSVRSPGYLELTVAVLRDFGVASRSERAGTDLTFVLEPGVPRAECYVVPPDPSARAFPLALAALCGRDGTALLPGRAGDPHPDWDVDGDVARLQRGGDVVFDDLARRPDCVPALAVVAATRPGTTTMRGLATLRVKESDRLAALAQGLAAAGAQAAVHGDDLVVRGPLAAGPAAPRRLPTPPDHRIVMAFALLGAVLPHGVVVEHEAAVGKSWPSFFDWLGRCADVAPA